MGLFGVTMSLGFSGGNAIGGPIKQIGGMEGLFMTGAILGFVFICFVVFYP